MGQQKTDTYKHVYLSAQVLKYSTKTKKHKIRHENLQTNGLK